MTPPRKTSLLPAISVIRSPTMPPVHDSATARVSGVAAPGDLRDPLADHAAGARLGHREGEPLRAAGVEQDGGEVGLALGVAMVPERLPEAGGACRPRGPGGSL